MIGDYGDQRAWRTKRTAPWGVSQADGAAETGGEEVSAAEDVGTRPSSLG